MLESLLIRGFRGHEERQLLKLARVNLLVGRNNSGKTAVLDAVELLVRDGHPRTLASLSGRRVCGSRKIDAKSARRFTSRGPLATTFGDMTSIHTGVAGRSSDIRG